MPRTWITAAVALAVCAPAYAADLKLDDTSFVTGAAQAGITEIELGKLAIATSSDPDVRAFAEQMIADHQKANDELSALAAEGGVSMPTAPDTRQAAVIEDLRGKTGADFDEEYAERMKTEHAKAVALFEAAAQSRDVAPALTQFAKRTVSTLEHHREMAGQLAAGELELD